MTCDRCEAKTKRGEFICGDCFAYFTQIDECKEEERYAEMADFMVEAEEIERPTTAEPE